MKLTAAALMSPLLSPKSLGKAGELFAASYLEKNGYTVIARNFRTRFGELDVVAMTPQKNQLAIIEVKTRRSRSYGSPEMAITPRKQSRLRHAAIEFVQQSDHPLPPLRFDAFTIIPLSDSIAYHHMEGAF